MSGSTERRPLDLVIDGYDVSSYVDEWATCNESRVEWTVHTALIRNEDTREKLQALNGKTVTVKYRLRSPHGLFPWCSGRGRFSWRQSEKGSEEIILHGVGRLEKEKSNVAVSHTPTVAEITMTSSIGGVVTKKDEGIGTITFQEEDPEERSEREEHIRIIQEAEVNAFTSPKFVLFLAKSALSSHRLLHDEGLSNDNAEVLYSSLIFLPLACEYFLKFMLFERAGIFKKEYEKHELLTLFDHLPFDLQHAVEDQFKDELERIGSDRTFVDIRVFLMKSQNAFTAIRYLFDQGYANTSRQLIHPENIAVMKCVSNALEYVAKQI